MDDEIKGLAGEALHAVLAGMHRGDAVLRPLEDLPQHLGDGDIIVDN
ncbi:MAG: hypothetical protein V3R69_00580 [candidate division NC10 bacterium]